MAVPTRPAVFLDGNARTATYQSVDIVDEALYNSFSFVYERAVFQRLVAMRLASIADQRRSAFEQSLKYASKQRMLLSLMGTVYKLCGIQNRGVS